MSTRQRPLGASRGAHKPLGRRVAASRPIAGVLPAPVVARFVAQLGDCLFTFPDLRASIEAAADGLPTPARARPDTDAAEQLDRHFHLLTAVVTAASAADDFVFTLLRVLRGRSPGLVALSFGAAAAFLTGAATSSARLVGVDHQRSVQAFADAVALVDEHVGELADDDRAIIERTSLVLHTHPRDGRTGALARAVAGEHVTAMLAMGEMLARRVGRCSDGRA